MESFILKEQKGFIKGRYILDVIITLWESLEYINKFEIDMIVFKIDFEKAYDRVDWAFLEDTMLCMGFLAAWIRGVASLYRSDIASY